MPSITLCPKCTQPVGVPDLAGPAAEVRCPRCAAEYKLADAFPSDVPELMVIGGLATAPPDGSWDVSDMHLVDDELALPDEMAAAELAGAGHLIETSAKGVTDGGAMEGREAAADHDSAAAATGGVGVADAGDRPAPTFALESSAGAAAATQRGAKKKSKRRGPGLLGQMIGIVVFGFIGLGLGYGVLKWWKPEAAKPFDDRLGPLWASVSSLWSAQQPGGPKEEPKSGLPDFGIVVPGKLDGGTPGGAAGSKQDASRPGGGSGLQGPGTVAAGGPAQDGPGTAPALGEKPPGDVFGSPPSSGFGVETVAVEELRALVETAHKATRKSPGVVNGEVFKALCEVGRAAALVQDPDGPQGRRLLRESAEMLRTLSEPEARQMAGVFAYLWLFDERRPPDKTGVLIVGRVERLSPLKTSAGELFATELAVRGDSKAGRITVLSVARPEYHVHDTAGVLGTIVRDPSSRLPWYTGGEPQLVLGGVAIRLRDRSQDRPKK